MKRQKQINGNTGIAKGKGIKPSLWAAAVAVLTVIAMLAAGCSTGGNNGNARGTANPGGESSPTTSADPGALPSDPVAELEPVELVWYLRASEPNNVESVIKRANELIYDKIKATVNFRFINPGDYNEKMQLAMTSGEVYDLAFTSVWANSFPANVSKGAYIPLNELLEPYPELRSLFRPEMWEAVTIDGDIYGVPNNQIMTTQHGLWFKKDLVDKYGIDIHAIKSIEDLGDVLQVIKDNEPDIIPIREGYPAEVFSPVTYPQFGGYRVDPATGKVVSTEEERFRRFKLMREWNQKGYFPADVATLKNDEALLNEGKIFSRYSRPKPGADAEIAGKYGYEVVTLPTGPAEINASAVLSTLTAVSRTSKHPERAVMLIDLVNKDREIYNLLSFGIEGQDYTKVEEKRIEPIAGGYLAPNWMIGNVFNSYLIPGQSDDVWEETKALNDSATVDPFIAYTFDRTPVESELARISAIEAEFGPILKNGLDDPDKTYAAYIEKRLAAGYDKVVAEIERQFAVYHNR